MKLNRFFYKTKTEIAIHLPICICIFQSLSGTNHLHPLPLKLRPQEQIDNTKCISQPWLSTGRFCKPRLAPESCCRLGSTCIRQAFAGRFDSLDSLNVSTNEEVTEKEVPVQAISVMGGWCLVRHFGEFPSTKPNTS